MDKVIKNAEEKMKKTVQHLETEFSEIRAGRANPAVLDKVRIDYYGTPTPINQVAAVSVSEARTLTIQPWDKSLLRVIEKAIQKSDISVTLLISICAACTKLSSGFSIKLFIAKISFLPED